MQSGALLQRHIEENEPDIGTLIKEVLKEVGIEIEEKNLFVAHAGPRKTKRNNIDIFMECRA